MSLLNRGARRPIAKVGLTVFALAAFQVLAVIGAGVASATTGCTFDPSNGKISITIDPGEAAAVAVDDASDLDPESPSGAILFSGTDDVFGDFDQGVGTTTQCGSATTSNTTLIVVLGSPGNDEFFYLDNGGWNGGGPFASTTAWAIDMGSQTVGGLDEVDIYLVDDGSNDDNLVITDSAFTMNGAAGTLLGVEYSLVRGFDGEDVLDASGGVNTIFDLHAGPGDDWAAPGAQAVLPFALLFGEEARGGGGFDTLSYGTRTTSVVIDNSTGLAGHSANADCDVLDPGDEQDIHGDFEAFESGSGNDCLVGDLGTDETFIPGDGDDDITGNGVGDDDVLDYSSSSAGMLITPAAGTATGQGADTFTGITQFVGSAFDDTLIFDGTTTLFNGGAGIDLVDGGLTTAGVVIDLDTLDGLPLAGVGAPADSLENAIGGTGNDGLIGNDLNNNLTAGDGDDVLTGAGGNDFLLGGNGNDTYSGGLGADTVSFQGAPGPNGVEADLSLGFATGEGSDALLLDLEIVKGSGFDDNITGGELGLGGSINFRFVGAAGDDILTGSTSNDTLKGGAGDDVVRAGNGDDTLAGAGGDDLLVGGKGFDIGKGGKGDDVCKGVESQKSCGTQKNPAKVQLKSLVAKLV